MSRREFDIKLNVYDLVPRANRWLGAVGVGAYHSGVEVNGQEYFFAQGGGICQCVPRSCTQVGAFKEEIHIGDYFGTAGSIRDIVAGMRASWSGDSYDLVRKNCNNFASELCRELCGRGIPSWVNRAASFGRLLLPSRATQANGPGVPSSPPLAPPPSAEAAAAATEAEAARHKKKTLTAEQQRMLDKLRAKSKPAPRKEPD